MMPLHRRLNAPAGESPNQNVTLNIDDVNDKTKAGHPVIVSTVERGRTSSLLVAGLLALQMCLLSLVALKSRIKSTSHLVALLATCWVASLPAFLIVGVGLGIFGKHPSDLPHQRYIPLAVVATIVGNQLPTYLSTGIAAGGMLVFGLCSRPIEGARNSNSETGGSIQRPGLSGPMKAVLAVILITTVLLAENFFIWVVSATYKTSQNTSTLPEPLQDNGQLVLRHLLNDILDLTKRDIVKLRNMINVEWILVSGLGVSLVAIETQGTAMRRNLWSLALRGLFTLTIARAIRTISFLITVLPSQNPRCYFSHFPFPPPQEWGAWLMTGFIPQVNGGCNDLIISGHATVTSTLACVVTSVVDKPLFTTALWMFVAVDYMVEVYEGFHYSVDMWLGAVLVNFIWTVLAPVEASTTRENDAAAARKFYSLSEAAQSDWIRYSVPVMLAYIQVNGILIPKESANYTILVYIVAVIYQITTSGFQQYTQHCLFSLLYLALGIYL